MNSASQLPYSDKISRILLRAPKCPKVPKGLASAWSENNNNLFAMDTRQRHYASAPTLSRAAASAAPPLRHLSKASTEQALPLETFLASSCTESARPGRCAPAPGGALLGDA